MKRLLAVAASLVLFFGANADAEVKSLSIGVDEWPPYEFKMGYSGNEHISGFSTEVVEAVLKKMGVAIAEIRQYPWARAEKMLIDGYIDLLLTAATSEKRATLTYYPSESLVESAWVFYIRKQDEGKIVFNTLNDLKGKRIGVVRAYTYTPEFWDFVKAEKSFEEVPNDDINIRKLLANRLDVIIMDRGNGHALLKRLGASGQVLALKKPLMTMSLYSIFSRNSDVDKDFVDQYSSVLKTFKSTPEYRALFDKYFVN